MILFPIFLFGLFVGSFLNVIIDRLPKEEQFMRGRSRCDTCRKPLRWYDMFPVISWVLLSGRCRYCRSPISIRNPIVELLTGALFVGSYVLVERSVGQFFPRSGITLSVTIFNFQFSIIILYWIVASSLIAIFFIDLKHKIIPDELVITALLGAIGVLFLNPNRYPVSNYVLSALGASSFFILLILITRGRGMGWGDVKFGGVMGVLLGFPGIVVALYIAFLTGAMVSVMLILFRRLTLKKTIAFGPFLVAGTVSVYLIEYVPGGIEIISKLLPFY